MSGRDDAQWAAEGILPVLREDHFDVGGSPAPLRVYNQELREEVAEAIRRFPNTDAPQWIGPEAVLAAVERFLLRAGLT